MVENGCRSLMTCLHQQALLHSDWSKFTTRLKVTQPNSIMDTPSSVLLGGGEITTIHITLLKHNKLHWGGGKLDLTFPIVFVFLNKIK